jgi:hypothetical protein
MQSYGLSVDIGGGTSKYKDMEFPLLGDIDDGGVTRRVLLAEDVYIPAQSESVIWGRVQSNGAGTKAAPIEATEEMKDGLAVGRPWLSPIKSNMSLSES